VNAVATEQPEKVFGEVFENLKKQLDGNYRLWKTYKATKEV